jgi:hypothetical protein
MLSFCSAISFQCPLLPSSPFGHSLLYVREHLQGIDFLEDIFSIEAPVCIEDRAWKGGEI